MRTVKKLLAVAAVLALWTGSSSARQPPPARTHLVIVVDGLRPDYVTPDVMPRLTQLGQRGIAFNAHHAVFPTVTRVNASSFVTGVYPEAHGLMGNTIYVPKANPTKTLDTGQRESLEAVASAEGTEPRRVVGELTAGGSLVVGLRAGEATCIPSLPGAFSFSATPP